jgi:hypothetical protein
VVVVLCDSIEVVVDVVLVEAEALEAVDCADVDALELVLVLVRVALEAEREEDVLVVEELEDFTDVAVEVPVIVPDVELDQRTVPPGVSGAEPPMTMESRGSAAFCPFPSIPQVAPESYDLAEG